MVPLLSEPLLIYEWSPLMSTSEIDRKLKFQNFDRKRENCVNKLYTAYYHSKILEIYNFAIGPKHCGIKLLWHNG